jgi:tetratricopeptide (TPR) repeat protein
MNQKGFIDLRDRLSTLYPDIGSIRRLVDDAGMRQARVDFASNAVNVWHSVLKEAEKTDCIDTLLDVVTRENPTSEEWRKAYVAYHQSTAQAMQRRIDVGLARERQPARTRASRKVRSKSINPKPSSVPHHFQDRSVETRLLVEQLRDENKRLLVVMGRGGIGKTTMVCRLLEGIEAGRLPDDLGKQLGELAVDGLIYLSQNGAHSHQISAANLFAALCKLLPAGEAEPLEALYRDPQNTVEAKIKLLLTHFTSRRVIVLFDNLEDLIDPATGQMINVELNELLLALLRAPVHGVTVICTTRILPQKLALTEPQLQYTLTLDEGLESPYAENILRSMDREGKLGLKDAPAQLLAEARKRTRGYPRALEALAAILSSDRSTSLPELLGDEPSVLPQHVVEELVGQAYSRLDRLAQIVMQALAIYARPVTPTAIEYLLQPYLAVLNARTTLNRLVNMYFVRKEGESYYLHPVDRNYALGRIAEGAPGNGAHKGDDAPPLFTRFALWQRGADYFAHIQTPASQWQRLEDLNPQLAEFDMRCLAQEYSTAASILTQIGFNYLLRWGYVRLLIELRERLLDKLSEPKQRRSNLGHLGIAYAAMGQMERAIDHYQAALIISQELGDRRNESAALVNLGIAYATLGQVEDAIDHYQRALAIAQEINDRQAECAMLGNLGAAYADLGQTQRAIDHYQRAITIAREIGDARSEGAFLGNLGLAYAGLGQLAQAIEHYQNGLTIAQAIGHRQGEGSALSNLGNACAALGEVGRAIDYYQQGLTIAKEIGDRTTECILLINLGDAQLDQANPAAALSFYTQATQIANQLHNVQTQSESHYGLALAQLLTNNLIAAAQIVATARHFDYPTNNANTLVLQGIIQLRLSQPGAAQEAFLAAVAQANRLLEGTPQNYTALQTLGLAQAGLALCSTHQAVTDADATPNSQLAIHHSLSAYRAARVFARAPGLAARALRLFDAVAVMDTQNVLAGVRDAVASEYESSTETTRYIERSEKGETLCNVYI